MCFIPVCSNTKNQVCNSYGVNDTCGKKFCGSCILGYQGDNCGQCASGFYPFNGTSNEVDPITGEGVYCKGMIVKLKFTKYFKFCIFESRM